MNEEEIEQDYKEHPNEGQASSGGKPDPQPPYQQQPQYQPPPKKDPFENIVKKKTLVMIIIAGLLVIMVSAIIINAAQYSDDADTINNVVTTGQIIRDIGVFLTSGGMLLGAILRDDWNKWIRIAMAGFALVLIIFGYFGVGLQLGLGTGGPF